MPGPFSFFWRRIAVRRISAGVRASSSTILTLARTAVCWGRGVPSTGPRSPEPLVPPTPSAALLSEPAKQT
jgi:hypothetical protein